MRFLATLLATALLTVSATAQGGGFTAGDLYVYFAHNGGIDDGLKLVDPTAGVAVSLVDVANIVTEAGNAAFDPWRQRIVFGGRLDGSPVTGLWAIDAAGQAEDLGLHGFSVASLAPVGDGRIYCDAYTSGHALRWIDAGNVLHDLLDASGTQLFVIDGDPTLAPAGIAYDAATNALFVAVAATKPCPGGVADRVNVRKLPLSADGTRVIGPVGCAQFEAGTNEHPVGWSRHPSGQLLLAVDVGTNIVSDRLILVDPATLSMTAFATLGSWFGSPNLPSGTWSTALGQGVIIDTFLNALRTFAQGSSGLGTVIPITGAIDGAAGSCSLFEIPATGCEGGWMGYGAGLAGTGNLVPLMSGSGCPEPGALVSLGLGNAVGGAAAVLFAGLAPAAVPFKGGSLLLGSIVAQVPLTLAGAPGAAGAGSITLPVLLPADPVLHGVSVYLQGAAQDAGAMKGVSLSQGLRMEIG